MRHRCVRSAATLKGIAAVVMTVITVVTAAAKIRQSGTGE
jgi:hypothetical protein